MSDTQQLYQLQQIDNQIEAAKRRLAEIKASLVESEALKVAKEHHAQSEAVYKTAQTQVTNLDLEVKGLQQKIAQNEKRLYSGTVVNPKEAGALQDEVASSKRWLAKREEDLLEAMIEAEEGQERYQLHQKKLAQIQQLWDTEQADLLAEQAEQQQALETLTKQRRTLTRFIVDDDLADYERLRRKFGGVAVGAVEGGTCLSCGVMVPNNLIQNARSDSQHHYCEACGRILHIL